MAGVTSTGLVIKSLTDIKAEIIADLQATVSASLDVSDETFIGQANQIFSDKLDQAWQALAQVYAAAYRSTAQGTALDDIGALTGTGRLAAAASTGVAVAVGTNATALSAGRVVSVAGAPLAKFTTLLPYTITTVAARAVSTVYAVGDLRTNDGGKIYYASIAGTSSAGGGPTGTSNTIVDGGVTWAYVATAAAAVVMAVTATATGPTVASVNTLTTIETPVSGWASVTNPTAAVIGRDVETDAAYRVRQVASLTVSGSSTPNAIRADVLSVSGVTAALVFENASDVTDVNGVPPHAFETLVLGGLDQSIANQIWESKPAGIATYGAITSSVTDSAGTSHTVKFSRPTQVPFYVTVDVIKDALTFPTDGVTQIQNALVAFWATKLIGDSVIRSQLFAPIDAISGTTDITNIRLGIAPAPAGTSNIPITSRQLATLSAANIVVNVT